ncbi:MAG: hypothetical protein ABIQ99_00410 [Thermoflexales bacterium]
MKILETSRLILRRQIPDDLDALWALCTDPDVLRFIPEGPLRRQPQRIQARAIQRFGQATGERFQPGAFKLHGPIEGRDGLLTG